MVQSLIYINNKLVSIISIFYFFNNTVIQNLILEFLNKLKYQFSNY